jgi:7,8-dihydropterin-6-yl-methyl-4-(beta-D-ribofuranosyl)aminobenzene 5'-phosphate synthase
MRYVIAVVLLLVSGIGHAGDSAQRITILYDAFGTASSMRKDWGFSALVEYAGHRILFDTGNNAEIFAGNAKAAGVDLPKLDFAVISHRHLDHTAGISHLLQVNPAIRIYAPKEAFGPFGSSLPNQFYRKDNTLSAEIRYFDGEPPETMEFGTVWPGANFSLIEKTTEIAPGIFLIATVSDVPGTRELRELSLAIRSPQGLIIVVGCSHPGIDRIIEGASAIDQRIDIVFGGLHLPNATDEQIHRIGTVLPDSFRVAHLAPGHCTGEPAFAKFQLMWGENYLRAGVGSVIDLP